MKDIIKKYLKWKEGRDDDYVYDEIHDFLAGLGRADLVDIMEYIVESQNK